MNERGKKLEPKLKLDMPFDEALARYVRVKPAELNEAIEKSKGVQNDEFGTSPRKKRLRPPKGEQ